MRKSAGGAAKSPAKAKVAKTQPEESEEDEDEEESDEEEETPKAAPVKGKAKKVEKKVAKAEESDDDDDEEDDDDDDDDDEEEEDEAAAENGKKADVDEEDDDDDDDDDEDDDDEEEEEKEEKMETDSKKRKKKAEDEKPAKKAKSEDVVSLFVGNLGELETAKIEKFFKKNEIVVAEVRRKDNLGHCFVDLENAEDLEKALALNGEKIGKVAIKIEQAKSKKDKEAGKTDEEKARDLCTLFVKNLPFEVTEEDLSELFDDVKEVRLPTGYGGNKKGFAFIQFESAKEVEDAIKEHQGVEFKGRTLFLDKVGQGERKRPEKHRESGKSGTSKVLFIKNLPYSLTSDQLQGYFEGSKSARIATFSDTGKPRGFGFVDFDDPETCKAAYDSMLGGEIEGRAVIVDFASELGEGHRGGGFHRGRGGGRGFGGRGRGGDRRGGRGGFRGRGGRGFRR